MDGNVHFNSRLEKVRRLCFYFFLVIMAGGGLVPNHSTGVYDARFQVHSAEIELAVCHVVGSNEKSPEASVARVAPPSLSAESRKPAVRVKTGYHAIIEQAGQRHGVEAAMIQAIIMAESSYNPHAVSNRGAAGLMQLMPATADSMGVKDRFNPEHNINGGVRYFKRLLIRFDGDTHLALAAYNAGARKVRQYNGVPPYKTTRSYIARVFQYYQRYKDLANHTPNKA